MNIPASYPPAAYPAPSTYALSWRAIIAGAVASVGLSLILLVLGTGLGFSMISPWASEGWGTKALGISTIAWISFMSLAASAVGGYMAGRLRERWVDTQPDEVHFRDSAHGFLAWSVATLLTAAFFTTTIKNIVETGAQAGAAVVHGAAETAQAYAASSARRANGAGDRGRSDPLGYFIDYLLRSEANPEAAVVQSDPTMTASDVSPRPMTGMRAPRSEVARIFRSGLQSRSLPAADRRYLASLVARRTGLSQAEAERRVDETFRSAQARIEEAATAAKNAADQARKISAATALWLCVSLFLGAFIASFMAIYGGRRRDT